MRACDGRTAPLATPFRGADVRTTCFTALRLASLPMLVALFGVMSQAASVSDERNGCGAVGRVGRGVGSERLVRVDVSLSGRGVSPVCAVLQHGWAVLGWSQWLELVVRSLCSVRSDVHWQRAREVGDVLSCVKECRARWTAPSLPRRGSWRSLLSSLPLFYCSALNLRDNGLRGTIPAAVSQLTALTYVPRCRTFSHPRSSACAVVDRTQRQPRSPLLLWLPQQVVRCVI